MLFKTEVVYSAFTLFQGLGMLMGFLITTFYCTHIKIIVMISLTCLCFFCGIYLNVRNKRENAYEKRTKSHEIEKLKNDE